MPDDNKQLIEENDTETEPKSKKNERTEKEKAILLSRLAESNFFDIRTKVAYILNHFPFTRDSDTHLALKYWKVFHSSLLNLNAVPFESFHELPKFTSISRARAKIQNEFDLFKPSERILEFREKMEEQYRAEQSADKPEDPLVSIYCDESGKNNKFKIVGSLWICDGINLYKIEEVLREFKKQKEITKEFHFTELKKTDLPNALEFIDCIIANSQYLSFKGIALNSENIRLSEDETIARLHYQLIIHGIEHEVKTGRFSLPRLFQITKDKEDGQNALRLKELEQKLKSECRDFFKQKIEIESVCSENSATSNLIQVSDLFSGAINRKLNNISKSRNHKDEFMDTLFSKLGVSDLESQNDSINDFATVFFIS